MDRIQKFLRKLDPKRRAYVRSLICAIIEHRLEGLDVTPIRGHKDYFRCRTRDIRIIFIKTPLGNVIEDVDWRSRVYRRLH